LILVLISNFFFQAVWPGGNYVGQYCSLLALIHILYMFIYFISECYAVHHITYDPHSTDPGGRILPYMLYRYV